jgi:nitrate/nitrite transporter NarK
MAIMELKLDPTRRELRQFSALWLVAGAALATSLWYKSGLSGTAIGLFAAAGALGVLGLIRPTLMRPVWVVLILVTYPIGWVVSHLLLAAIFYLCLTPTGWIMRLFRYDPMQRKFDRQATTYWQPHKEPESSSRYYQQF